MPSVLVLEFGCVPLMKENGSQWTQLIPETRHGLKYSPILCEFMETSRIRRNPVMHGAVECLETARDIEMILEEKRGGPWRVGTWTGLSCWMVRLDGETNVPDPDERFRMLGGLPEKMDFELLEPLRQLFKDEVRQVGLELELPKEIVFRQPFPGPGLAVRVIGEITPERLQIL